VEDPYLQCFCGKEFLQHRLTFDRSAERRRQRAGEDKLLALLHESLATGSGALKPSDLARVVADITVQPK
jgi:IS5 family transposase